MIGVSSIHTTHFNHFLLIRTSIDSQCLNRYKVNKFQRHLVDAEDKKAIYSTIRHFIPRGSLPIFNARLKLLHFLTYPLTTVRRCHTVHMSEGFRHDQGHVQDHERDTTHKISLCTYFQYLSLLFINKSPTFASIK